MFNGVHQRLLCNTLFVWQHGTEVALGHLRVLNQMGDAFALVFKVKTSVHHVDQAKIGFQSIGIVGHANGRAAKLVRFESR
jgi:hypothetical protein